MRAADEWAELAAMVTTPTQHCLPCPQAKYKQNQVDRATDTSKYSS